MMMKSSCIECCLDVQTPVKVSFTKLHEWAQADKEFLRKLTIDDTNTSSSSSSSVIVRSSNCQQSYAYRQRYLRSYTFSRKESAAQRTKKWLKDHKHKFKDNNNSKQEDRFISTSTSGSCSFIHVVFKFLFLCVAKVDVRSWYLNNMRKLGN